MAHREVADVIALGGFTTDPLVHAWVFDVSDPADPQLASTILHADGGRSTDVEIRGTVLWVATEYDPDDVARIAEESREPGDAHPDAGLLGGLSDGGVDGGLPDANPPAPPVSKRGEGEAREREMRIA